MNGTYNSGLPQKEWYLLKDALLGASYHKGNIECKWYMDLPEHLKEHEVGKLIYDALYKNDGHALDKAAKIMAGGSDKAWLDLEKS